MIAERSLLDGASRAIAALPNAAVHSHEDDVRIDERRFDRIVHAEVNGRSVEIVIETKAHGYPRDAQAAADQLSVISRHRGGVMRIPMFVAPAISAASREVLRGHGIGYWDPGGSIYLEMPGAFYLIDRSSPEPAPRKLRSAFSGRRTNVLHAMLLEPDREWHVVDLAARSGVAQSTVHQVFVFLEEQLWVKKVGQGPKAVRILREPGALLDAWAQEHSLSSYVPQRYYRWSQRRGELLDELAAQFDELDVDYALTLAAGAQRVAPFVTDIGDISMLVPPLPLIDAAMERVGLEPVDEGETVTLYITDSPSSLLFRQRVDDVWVASDVQLYLDLWNWPRRGREQARHLRTERLGF